MQYVLKSALNIILSTARSGDGLCEAQGGGAGGWHLISGGGGDVGAREAGEEAGLKFRAAQPSRHLLPTSLHNSTVHTRHGWSAGPRQAGSIDAAQHRDQQPQQEASHKT